MDLISLRHGDLRAELEPSTGFLRNVRYRNIEVLRTAYVAVRDERWSTVPVSFALGEHGPDRAQWILTSESRDVPFRWRIRCVIDGSGLRFDAEGEIQGDFRTNRTGVCVLHPLAGVAGQPCTIERTGGGETSSHFPAAVAPHQPFRDIRAMRYLTKGTGEVRIEFSGEIFETEDQRNWSDGSFKTYGRPLDAPKPYPLKRGDVIRQGFHLAVRPGEGGFPKVPSLGVMLQDAPLSDAERTALRALGLGHVGVPIRNGSLALFESAKSLELPIQAHIFGPPVGEVARALEGARLLEVVLDMGVDPSSLRAHLDAPILFASRGNFTELNRTRPDPTAFDGAGFALNPQVHTYDDRSILESVETHRLLAEQAAILGGSRRVAVGPVVFGSRDWSQPDPRLKGPLAAEFLEKSIQAIAGVSTSATYFSANGPESILGTPAADVLRRYAKAPPQKV